MEKYILTIDQGTTSSRAILFDKFANTKAKYQMEFTQIRKKNGWVEHNANEIYDTVIECVKNVINDSKIKLEQIDSIAITNQRETAVLFNKKGKPLCNAICWQSNQSKEICDKLINDGYEDFIYKKTGLHINPYFSASKIKYMIENNLSVREALKNNDLLFGTIDTYLLYRLTEGRSFYTDITNASRTMLFNIFEEKYDDELLKLFNIPKEILPEVKESSDNFGYVKIDGKKIPIYSLIGDQQASLFGHACINPGDIKNTYGTGCFMLLNTGDKPVLSKNGLLTTVALKYNGKTSYALEGSVFIAGAAVQWLRDGIRIINSSKETYERALKEKTNDLIVVPSFQGMGTPYWDNDTKGAMFGITLNTTQDSIVKATLEGICFEAMDVIEVMKKDAMYNALSLSVDGGASENDYLLQFESDIMQTIIKRPRQIETTALGACFLAGLKSGFFKDLEEVKKLNQTEKIFYPIIDKEEAGKLYKRWLKAVEATRMFK